VAVACRAISIGLGIVTASLTSASSCSGDWESDWSALDSGAGNSSWTNVFLASTSAVGTTSRMMLSAAAIPLAATRWLLGYRG